MNQDQALDDLRAPLDGRGKCAAGLAELYARPGFIIRRAHQTAVSLFIEASEALGITTTQYGIMFALAHVQDLDQIGLARLVKLDRSTTGLVLDLLERRGLVERLIHAADRRRRVLSLTPAGRNLYERTREPAAAAVLALFGPTGKTDVSRFLDVMELLVTAASEPADPTAADTMRPLYRRPGFLIRRAHQISTALFLRECHAFEITSTQYGVLFALRQCPAADQAALAWLVRLDRSTTAMVVGLLESRGLIERRIDIIDRRRRVLNLTAAGTQLLKEVAPAAQAAVEQLMQPLSAGERGFVLGMLNDIVARHQD
jgi:DNA-binding MarR family transcriptional regulator